MQLAQISEVHNIICVTFGVNSIEVPYRGCRDIAVAASGWSNLMNPLHRCKTRGFT